MLLHRVSATMMYTTMVACVVGGVFAMVFDFRFCESGGEIRGGKGASVRKRGRKRGPYGAGTGWKRGLGQPKTTQNTETERG